MRKSSRSWIGGATRSSRKSGKVEADLARVLSAVEKARVHIPDYGASPISTGDVRRLASAVGLQVHRSIEPMDSPAILLPPWAGSYQLVMADWVSPLVARHVTLHEIGHILTGDIEEPTILQFEGPMPEAEDVVDLFSLVALLDDEECAQGPEFIETRIRELVPLDNRGWQVHRIPRLAGKLGRMRGALSARLSVGDAEVAT